MRTPRLVISLTSIPSRFPEIGPTLDALLAQTAQVEEIRLHIPHRYRRFPEFDGTLPKVPAVIRIVRPEEDLGPATKVLFTAEDLRGEEDVQILFCDDDRRYAPDWAATLAAAQAERPGEAVALSGWEVDERLGLATPAGRREPRHRRRDRRWDWAYRRARIKQQWALRSLRATRRKPPRRLMDRAGYADVFEGFGGVVVRPQFFGPEAHDIPSVVWTVDDVWLSGQLARKGIPIWVPQGLYAPQTTDADDADALWRNVIDGADNPTANLKCAELMRDQYGVWGP
ncbi:glycosyltransferase family A protein [Oceanicola sp. 502str15]|uniref:glycosyltransferase family A protein n=1 Tax=Oceanicola sp. 502str15 TaxID=2696061 RepID=UPI0020956638|nr:glycosyltransferase family A protein [Oceanicola sp. 502str15]MCO6385178.1 glycosyltransferase family 2 protein [Oceanicola sp. 502str15]